MLVIARYEAIPYFTGRTCIAPLPIGDCFVPRNDGFYMYLNGFLKILRLK